MNIKTAVSIRAVESSGDELVLNASVPGVFLAVAIAHFVRDGDGQIQCENIHVEEGHRRKGVATALYAYAENHFGRPVAPSEKLTPDSVAFLEARGVAIPVTAEVKAYSEWFGFPGDGEDADDDSCISEEEDDPLRVRRTSP